MTLTAQNIGSTEHLTEVFESLYRSLSTSAYRYACVIGLSPEDCEDTVQESFLALWAHLLARRIDTNIDGWFIFVVRNKALKCAQSIKRSALVAERPERITLITPEEHIRTKEIEGVLRSVLRTMPTNDRNCFLLWLQGMQYRQTAQALGTSVGTVFNCTSRTHARCVAMLKRRM